MPNQFFNSLFSGILPGDTPPFPQIPGGPPAHKQQPPLQMPPVSQTPRPQMPPVSVPNPYPGRGNDRPLESIQNLMQVLGFNSQGDIRDILTRNVNLRQRLLPRVNNAMAEFGVDPLARHLADQSKDDTGQLQALARFLLQNDARFNRETNRTRFANALVSSNPNFRWDLTKQPGAPSPLPDTTVFGKSGPFIPV